MGEDNKLFSHLLFRYMDTRVVFVHSQIFYVEIVNINLFFVKVIAADHYKPHQLWKNITCYQIT